MSLTQSFMILLSRIFIGVLFIYYGILKGGHWNYSVQYLMSMGIPASQILVAGTIALDFLGGIFVILGYRMRFGAWLLVFSMLFSMVILFGFWQNQTVAMTQVFCNLAILGGCFTLIIVGPGAMSVDAR